MDMKIKQNGKTLCEVFKAAARKKTKKQRRVVSMEDFDRNICAELIRTTDGGKTLILSITPDIYYQLKLQERYEEQRKNA